MAEPRTAAGRALLDDLIGENYLRREDGTREMVLAVEAEAAELAGGLDLDDLAEAIHRGFSYPERRFNDRFEIYASVQEIAEEIMAQLYRQSVVIPAGQGETPRTGEGST